MGQDDADGAEEGVENNTSPTPAPSASNSMHNIVQINLLLLDAAFEPPEINFPGGIETLGW